MPFDHYKKHPKIEFKKWQVIDKIGQNIYLISKNKMSSQPSFPCPQCNAQLVWNPAVGKLVCEYCGYSVKPQDNQVVLSPQQGERKADTTGQPNQAHIQEYDLFMFLRNAEAQKRHGYGVEVKRIICNNCGASLNIEPYIKATQCSFCGSSTIIEEKSQDASILTPESLVPFVVDRTKAFSTYKAWLKRGWFHPDDLKKRATQAHLNGVYLPFWTFDAKVYSKWRAEAGHYYYKDESYYVSSGGRRERRTRRVRKVRWTPVSGEHRGFYDDVLVHATASISPQMLERVYPFDTKSLVPYNPGYLSGWSAENYRINIQQGWEIAQGKIYSMEIMACAQKIHADTYRDLSVASTYSDVTFKLVLLPVWISSYIYKGKTFQFLINGQTGKIYGKKPISAAKVALAIIIGLLIISAIVLFFKFFIYS
ncbi:MAG: hypothetical protein NC907_05875 [Candidatus Omnitrophica bacterium]|nr:hypothetical protein [Candidatus Omnitrophota bacterium]